MSEYPKIPSPFKRETDGPNRNKLIDGAWSCREFEVLAETPWVFTEKVDGTNVRVYWDGHKPSFRGRTDNAQMPPKLLAVLEAMFPEELLEQQFGAEPAVLYGEGYGAGIQKGGVYRPDQSFVLFDVFVPRPGFRPGWWLERATVEEIGFKLGIDVVPRVFTGPLTDAIEIVRHAGRGSYWGPTVPMEGFVGTSALGLLNRAGERLIVKVKTRDLAP